MQRVLSRWQVQIPELRLLCMLVYCTSFEQRAQESSSRRKCFLGMICKLQEKTVRHLLILCAFGASLLRASFVVDNRLAKVTTAAVGEGGCRNFDVLPLTKTKTPGLLRYALFSRHRHRRVKISSVRKHYESAIICRPGASAYGSTARQ